MKSKALWWVLGVVGIFFLICSLTITIVEYSRFKRQSLSFPAGSTIAGVPVDGLDPSDAAARLNEAYSLPLDLLINGNTIAVNPTDLGFEIDANALVQSALEDMQTGGYWSYLWNRITSEPVTVPLEAKVDPEKLRTYLIQEINPRYTQSDMPLTPIPNTTNFALSTMGSGLDLDQAVTDITAALLDDQVRQVTLPLTGTDSASPDWSVLEGFLKHNIQWIGFDGLVEVYLQALDSGQTLHFATWDGEDVVPDIAFTGGSTMKVPVIISIFRHLNEPTPDVVIGLMEEMIVESENTPADTLMQYYLDENLGPLIVTEDMQALGMESTFLSAYFYLGAPPLRLVTTPANTRTDINLNPDSLNQMVTSELGRLMNGIYHCAADGSGLLTETFPGEITQSECQTMVNIMSEPKPLQFINTALPPEATVTDKFGYVTELDGLMHSITDASIIYTPDTDFVLVVSVYQSDWLNMTEGARVIGRLAQTVYNFFNPENQAYWWLD